MEKVGFRNLLTQKAWFKRRDKILNTFMEDHNDIYKGLDECVAAERRVRSHNPTEAPNPRPRPRNTKRRNRDHL